MKQLRRQDPPDTSESRKTRSRVGWRTGRRRASHSARPGCARTSASADLHDQPLAKRRAVSRTAGRLTGAPHPLPPSTGWDPSVEEKRGQWPLMCGWRHRSGRGRRGPAHPRHRMAEVPRRHRARHPELERPPALRLPVPLPHREHDRRTTGGRSDRLRLAVRRHFYDRTARGRMLTLISQGSACYAHVAPHRDPAEG